jgi:hypothetical protein
MSIHDVIRDASITVAILNFVVSVAVAVSSAYSGRQKILQILVIWIIPVIGGVLLGVLMLTECRNTPRMGFRLEKSEDLSQIWSGLHSQDQNH